MISIGRVGAASAGRYYLERQAGCELEYYTGAGEPTGRWLGEGATAAGLTGELDGAGDAMLRGLLTGCGADGQRLVAPVLRADPRRRLPAEPLLRALGRHGAGLSDLPAAAVLVGAAARLADGHQATVDVAVVQKVSVAAGVDATQIYLGSGGRDVYGAAVCHAGTQVDVRRAGLDVTVSAPKSVSLLYGLGDADTAGAVREAHSIAVGEVVSYLQRHAATAARGHHGDGHAVPRTSTDGLIVAAFDHRSSRAGDPQLHTHLVIPNLVRGSDGRWSAMDTAAVYQHARTASSIYHAVLRGELTRRLGVQWTPVRRGIAEIDQMPTSAMALFSKRSAQIRRAMADRGTSGVKAAQAACLDTRRAKRRGAVAGLRERWQVEAAVHGLDRSAIVALTARTSPPAAPSVDALAARLFGSSGLTAGQTSFTRQDLARAVCEEIPTGTPVALADLDELVLQLLGRGEVVPVISGSARERRYTTVELLTIERATLDLAAATPPEPVAVVYPMIVANVLDGIRLSSEQTRAVHELVSSGRRVDVIAGPAGSGKTAALAAAHRLWAATGREVRGASLSWLAAGELEAATGIPSRSLTKTLHDADRYGLPPGVVFVLDEAGLVDTRTMHRLFAHIAAADGKVALVGDPHQLPEIGAGGIFATLAAQPTAIHLAGNQRQRQRWEQDALRSLRAGDPVTALDAYRRHGRIHFAPNKAELLDKIAADYGRAADHGDDVLVLAALRSDVTRLNQAIQQHRLHTGVLGDELVVAADSGPRCYRRGDRVIVTMNHRDRGLVNGMRGVVTGIHRRSGRVEVALDDGHQAALDYPTLVAGAIDLGYATTMHKAQGITVDTTLVYGLGPMSREHGYVALSRGRNENHLYLSTDTEWDPDCGPSSGSPQRTAAALTAELVEQLRDSRRQRLAAQQLPPGDPRRGRDEELYRQRTHADPQRGRSLGR